MAKGDGKARIDVMQSLTDKFVQMMEDGLADPSKWVRPWQSIGIARNGYTGKAYKGINQVWLGLVAEDADSEPIWATYKQWVKLGCVVQKGQGATAGVKWNLGKDKLIEQPDGTTKTVRGSLFPTGFYVFHAGQVEDLEEGSGCKAKVLARFAPKELSAQERTEASEQALNTLVAYTADQGIKVTHKGDMAAYSPAKDVILMPPRKAFDTSSSYVSTFGHECIHSTGASTRLDREGIKASDNRGPVYAFEELIAELGAAGLCRILNVDSEPREDHAHYLASWLGVLKSDKWALHRACKAADTAVGFLLEKAGASADLDVTPSPEALSEAETAVESAAVPEPELVGG